MLTVHCAGVTNVSFETFAGVFVVKVPWFTPGYSYCRWWGVTCCLTASESVLPTCSQGFQSVGQLSLTGVFLKSSCEHWLSIPQNFDTFAHCL